MDREVMDDKEETFSSHGSAGMLGCVQFGFHYDQPYRLTCVIDPGDLCDKVIDMGFDVRDEYLEALEEREEIVLLIVLKGAYRFGARLSGWLEGLPHQVEFAKVSSYRHQDSLGVVEFDYLPPAETIQGKRILIVEDIVDTGLTAQRLKEKLQELEPKHIGLCTLLDKPSRRKVDVVPEWVGFVIEDKFVVGYGLDYEGSLRNLPGIWEMELIHHCEDCGAETRELVPDGDGTFYCRACEAARVKGQR